VRKDRLTRRHEICFEDRYFGPGQHRFYPVVHTPDGRREVLSDRRDYALIQTPYDTGRIYVCSPASLACLGYCERMIPGSRVDLDAMHRLMGKRQEVINLLNEPIQDRHAEDAADRAAMIAHNDAVIAEARAGLPAPAEAARIAAEPGRVEEMLGGEDRTQESGDRSQESGDRTQESGDISEVL
jgi:hypothetical protein